jgi:hypothetical protein
MQGEVLEKLTPRENSDRYQEAEHTASGEGCRDKNQTSSKVAERGTGAKAEIDPV